MEQYTNHFNTTVLPDAHGESSKLGETLMVMKEKLVSQRPFPNSKDSA